MADFKAGDKAVLKRDLGDYKAGNVVIIQAARGYSADVYDWSAEVNGEHVFHVYNREIEEYHPSKEERILNLEGIVSKLQVQLDNLAKLDSVFTGVTKRTRLEAFKDYPVEYIYEDGNKKRFVKVGPDSWILITPSTRRSNESYIYRDHNMANR